MDCIRQFRIGCTNRSCIVTYVHGNWPHTALQLHELAWHLRNFRPEDKVAWWFSPSTLCCYAQLPTIVFCSANVSPHDNIPRCYEENMQKIYQTILLISYDYISVSTPTLHAHTFEISAVSAYLGKPEVKRYTASWHTSQLQIFQGMQNGIAALWAPWGRNCITLKCPTESLQERHSNI